MQILGVAFQFPLKWTPQIPLPANISRTGIHWYYLIYRASFPAPKLLTLFWSLRLLHFARYFSVPLLYQSINTKDTFNILWQEKTRRKENFTVLTITAELLLRDVFSTESILTKPNFSFFSCSWNIFLKSMSWPTFKHDLQLSEWTLA